MTSIGPIAGVAPLGAAPPTTPTPIPAAAPAQPVSLHAVLAGGANLGGTTDESWSIPTVPGVDTAVAGASGQPAAGQPAVSGGGPQAQQGAAAVNQEQLVAALQNVIAAVNQLIAALQAQGVTGGGGPGSGVGACGMPGCTMDHGVQQSMQGASGAPSTPSPRRDAEQGARREERSAGNAGDVRNAGNSSPVKDKTSTDGLTKAARRGLQEAHRYGLPLVSGKRSGGGTSDHDHGNAIDVGTLPIGVASSDGGTAQMKAFAEHMRQEGKAGRLDVKYIIRDGQIASARENWEWRPYTYPGKSAGELERLKQTNRGEYNRIQHYDHVHVSFG